MKKFFDVEKELENNIDVLLAYAVINQGFGRF